MSRGTVLISGAGIAGQTLAYWLDRFGFVPTLVERASEARTEGYITDFLGAGYDVVEKMGLLPALLSAGYGLSELRLVDARGRRRGGFAGEAFRAATNGRYTSVARGELSGLLRRSVQERVETLFGDSITSLRNEPDGAEAHFEHAPTRRFDLVIGADGLHSNVRRLEFGPEFRYEKFLGYGAAALEASGYRPRDEGVYVAHAVPGAQVARFSLRHDRTMFLFIIADAAAASIDGRDILAQKRYLHARFRNAGWECPRILAALDACDRLYFDRVSQIRMHTWWRGRVALLGDAAFAPSLLAGQGAALAVVGAYVLAGELAGSAHIEQGLARYQDLLGPFVQRKQDQALVFASSFAPRTQLGVFLRNQLSRTLRVPLLARLVLGRSLPDELALPDYPLDGRPGRRVRVASHPDPA